MGKFYELILAQSPKSTDSFELIDPVNNLSLENVVQPTKTDQSTNLQQINEVKRPRPSRFHPYERQLTYFYFTNFISNRFFFFYLENDPITRRSKFVCFLFENLNENEFIEEKSRR